MLLNTKQKQHKFILTMIIIIASATILNYGLYSLIDIYFIETASSDLLQNILIMIMIISIVSVLMFVLIPKEEVNKMMDMVGNEEHVIITPEQELENMLDSSDQFTGDENLTDTNK